MPVILGIHFDSTPDDRRVSSICQVRLIAQCHPVTAVTCRRWQSNSGPSPGDRIGQVEAMPTTVRR